MILAAGMVSASSKWRKTSRSGERRLSSPLGGSGLRHDVCRGSGRGYRQFRSLSPCHRAHRSRRLPRGQLLRSLARGPGNAFCGGGPFDPGSDRREGAALGRASDCARGSRPQTPPDPIVGYDAPGCRRDLSTDPRFAIGEEVQTILASSAGHTRLPAYARGRPGRITAQHGGWVFPDTHAHGAGERPAHLYTVAFEGQDLWGPESEPGVMVHLDLFEPYLLPRKEAP